MSKELSSNLKGALEAAEEALQGSPTGELELRFRRAVWDALDDGPTGPGTPGHRRRTVLDLRTVEHVKHVWERAYPSDLAVERVLEAARQVLAGERSPQWGDETMDAAWVAFLGRDEGDPGFLARSVGRAACVALFTRRP